MNIKKQIGNLFVPFLQNKEIRHFSLYPTDQKNIFKCQVLFPYKRHAEAPVELEVSFYLNYSQQLCLLDIKENNIFTLGSDFDFFLKNKIKNRIRGADKELRVLKIAKEIINEELLLNSNLRVLKVLKGSEYSDNNLKVDLWFNVSFDYKGEFDLMNGSFGMMIGIQVKSSFEYQNKHKIKHPYIPSISVKDSETDEDLKNKLSTLLFNASRFKLRQLYTNFSEKNDTHNKSIVNDIKTNIELSIESLHL